MAKVKKVASAAGVKRYGLPEGTPLDGSNVAKKVVARTAKPYLKDAKARLNAANDAAKKSADKPSVTPSPSADPAPRRDTRRPASMHERPAAAKADDMLESPEKKAARAHKEKWMGEYGLDAQEYAELLKMEKETANAKVVNKPIAEAEADAAAADLSGNPLSPEAQGYLDEVTAMLIDKSNGASFLDDMADMYRSMPQFGTTDDQGDRVAQLPEGVDAAAMRGVFKTALMKRGLTDVEAEKLLFGEVTMPAHVSEGKARKDLEKSEREAYLKSVTEFLDDQSAVSIQGMVNSLRERDFGAQQGISADEFRALYTQKLVEKGMTEEAAAKFVDTGEIPDTDPNSPLGQKANRKFPVTDAAYGIAEHEAMTEKWADTQRSLVTDDPKAADAVVRYIGSAYDPINKALRNKEIPWENGMGADYIRNMDRALVKQKTDEPITAFRLIRLGQGDGFDPNKLTDGSFYTDNAFLSTTINPEQYTHVGSLVNYDYDNAYTMEIRVPAGQRALYSTGLPQRVRPDNLDPKDPPILPGEEELILDRGTTYRVVKNDPYQRHIVVEVFTQRVVDENGQTVSIDGGN